MEYANQFPVTYISQLYDYLKIIKCNYIELDIFKFKKRNGIC